MNIKMLSMLVVFVIGSILAGCTKSLPESTETPTGTRKSLTPYLTPTSTIPASTPTPLAKIPVTPTPSATPFIHVVASGDTMLGIALRYGITLEALQAANPGVDPQFLSVDAQLLVPLGVEIQAEVPDPTPVSLDWAEPNCYPTREGGIWCFLLVKNNLDTAVENLSAWIGLYADDSVLVASAIAVGPLNILRPGDAMPLVVFFSPPLPTNIISRGELLTAVKIPTEDTRYLDWQMNDLRVEITGEMLSEARVTGYLDQPFGSVIPSQVWIMAVAYNHDGEVVGVRKVETNGELAFQLTLYSLEGVIARVEVFSEVRP